MCKNKPNILKYAKLCKNKTSYFQCCSSNSDSYRTCHAVESSTKHIMQMHELASLDNK